MGPAFMLDATWEIPFPGHRHMSATSSDADSLPPEIEAADSSQALNQQDESLLRVFLTACNHRWKELPALAHSALEAGCTQAQLRATIRHMPM